MIELVDGRKELLQWDTKRKIKTDIDCKQIHFSNTTYGKSCDIDIVDGTCEIPDELLQYSGKLYVWCWSGAYDNGYTKHEWIFDIGKRPKPAGYVFTPTEQKTIAGIEKQIGNLNELATEDKTSLVKAINEILNNSVVGKNGATFYPSVDEEGNLSWTNDQGLENPATVNIKGKDGKDYVLTDEDKAEIAALATADIETALDEIIAIQNILIGGEGA